MRGGSGEGHIEEDSEGVAEKFAVADGEEIDVEAV